MSGMVLWQGEQVDPATLTVEQVVARYEELGRESQQILDRMYARNRSINFHPNTLDGRASERRYSRWSDSIREQREALSPYLPDTCRWCEDYLYRHTCGEFQ